MIFTSDGNILHAENVNPMRSPLLVHLDFQNLRS